MANLQVKDGAAASKYLKATGAGSDVDPAIVEHEVTQAAHDELNANANLQVANADVANGNPVPVSDAGGSLTVDGSVTVAGTVTANAGSGPWPVTDNSGSLTVDDGGTTLTVDGTVTAAQATHDSLNANANLQVGNADVANGNPVPVSDAGGAITVDGTVTANAGTGPWPVTDNSGSLTVDDGSTTLSVDDGAGSLTVDGTVTANLAPTTSGGLSIFRSIDLDESEEEVKGSAGQLYGAYLYNLASSGKRYVKLYNDTAANVTVGTTTPVLTLPLDAGQGAVLSFEQGIAFSAAITAAATTGVADNDTGAPGANEVVANLFYK